MSSAEENPPSQRVRLTDLPAGEAGRVCGLEGKVEICQRLREMGLGESAVIEKVSGVSTVLCQVCGTRIALSDRAAQHIVVEQVRRSA
jgi:ferrous iron transport protein A